MSVVLIVDDEPAVREILSRWLSAAGYTTHQAADAESALELLATVPVAVALCDQTMPGQGGRWLVTQIHEKFPRTAIIIATGASVPSQVMLQRGLAGYLSKPFSRALVVSAVEDAMAWHRVASQSKQKPAP